MKFTSFSLKIFLTNTLFLSVPVIGLFYNLTQQVFLGDESHMTIIIGLFLLISIVVTLYNSMFEEYNETFMQVLKFLSKIYLFLGLIGTVIGLSILVNYLKFNGTDSPEQALNTMLGGISNSLTSVFFATLMGLVAKVVTETNIFFFKQRQFKIFLSEKTKND